jgi:hypothetical protein
MMRRLFGFKIRDGERVAEIGGGEGDLSVRAKSEGIHVVAFMEPAIKDISRLSGMLGPDTQCIQMRVGDPNAGKTLAKHMINTIVIQDVIEHIDESALKDFFDEFKVVAGKLPRLIGRTPNLKSHYGLRNSFGDNSHLHRFTERSLRNFLSELGYKSICIKEDPYNITGIISFLRYVPYKLILLSLKLKMMIIYGQNEGPMSPNIVFDAESK